MTDPQIDRSGTAPLALVEHIDDLLSEPHGFGSLLFDADGRLVVSKGATRLYTTTIEGGRWTSWVRGFHLATRTAGPASRVLTPDLDEDRAVMHHVMLARDGLYVGFYSNGRGVRAAVAPSPDGPFAPDPEFRLDPVRGWETRQQGLDGWSLEANGGYVRCDVVDGELTFWEGYDSYRSDGRLGDLGWARVALDLRTGAVRLVERHGSDPLPFRPDGWACARCGGNLSTDFRLRGLHPFFYYARPNADKMSLAVALSNDPLFHGSCEVHVIGGPEGREVLIEKFQAVPSEGSVLLFYESKLSDGTWRTGLRAYEIT